MKFKHGVVIGRFQPFHLGHQNLIEQALEDCETVIIALGSSNCASNVKNPYSPKKREYLIGSSFSEETRKRLRFVSVRDYLYDDSKWVCEVNNAVHALAGYGSPIALYGYHKDSTSYYLELFDNWKFVHATPKYRIDATEIRKLWFEEKGFAHLVPEVIAKEMAADAKTPFFSDLQEEYWYYFNYKAACAKAPFPPTFVTCDSVVLQGNHVLVVERKDRPGKGLWALPGGFIQSDETLKAAALRELSEETKIVFPKSDLETSIVAQKTFDAPGRSLRGRTITHAFCLKLNNRIVPKVEGSDDAARAFWIPVQEVYSNERDFFEDHAQIIDYFVSSL